MTRKILGALIVSAIAATTLVAPAQAGYKHRSHHHHKNHYFKPYFKYHKFHAYRSYYKPVCIKHKWKYSYGHKKWVCVLWK